jgi:uncharacterized membrane protein (UPF0127 family)
MKFFRQPGHNQPKNCRTWKPTMQAGGWIGILVSASLLWHVGAGAWAQKLSPAGNPIIPVFLDHTLVQAEVVSSSAKLFLGLGGRRYLAPGSGMLFIMPTLDIQEFCMRGMLIPIDIIWICHDRIIGFAQNLSPKDQKVFSSPAPADLVLEVPAGFVKTANLRVGARVDILD